MSAPNKCFLDSLSKKIHYTIQTRAEATYCSDGWIDLGDKTCVKMVGSAQGVSWFDHQIQCDAIGGFLPELISEDQVELFKNVLLSFDGIFGTSLVFLGGSDLTHQNEWRWLHFEEAVNNGTWEAGRPDTTPESGKDCMAVMSNSGLWMDISCTEINDQVGLMCMKENIPPVTTPGAPLCEEGWTFFQNETKSCYFWVKEPAAWTDASASCQSMIPGTTNLVSIQNEAETIFLATLAGGTAKDNFFTGGFREPGGEAPWNATGTWKWSDGSEWNYQNWFSGQPNDEDGYYVFANCYGSKGKWCDKGPDQKLSYMCEYDL